jgi:hypothetical protein
MPYRMARLWVALKTMGQWECGQQKDREGALIRCAPFNS